MGAVILETKRLILRPWRLEDAETLYALCRDPEIGPAAGWPVHTSVENSREVLKTVLMVPEVWAVTVKGDDTPVGSVGLKPASVEKSEPELGYWVGRSFWGCGYIPEAGRRVLEYCFLERGAGRVWCGHYEGNRKSQRVIEKCGFSPVLSREEDVTLLSERRLCHYYALTRQAWQAQREEQA